MSVTPKNLPKRTRILVKDLLFQEKHQLTDTQVDIMSYIFNAITWAMSIQGFMVLTNKKFMDDLPQIGKKTLDATLLQLVNKGLISREMVTVTTWGNARVRGIKISPNGMEYNSSLYTPTQQGIVNAYQERIDGLEADKQVWESKEKIFEEKVKLLEEQLKKALESEASAPKNEDLNEKETEKKKDIGEAEAVDSECDNAPKEQKEDRPKESLDDFVKRVRNQFILTSEPICNDVKGWQKETTFYINSYGKLSLNTKNRDFIQIKSPIEIKRFWMWLREHQERIGDVIDFKEMRENIGKLNHQYKNTKIKINGKEKWIEELVPIGKGLAIKIRDAEGKISTIANNAQQPIIYGYKVLEEFIAQVSM